MIYQAILDASIVGSTLALVVIAIQLRSIAKNPSIHEQIMPSFSTGKTFRTGFYPDPEITVFAPGDRVRVKQSAGFSIGATGTVRFQEPGPDKTRRCWVQRDGTESVAWFYNHELEWETEE